MLAVTPSTDCQKIFQEQLDFFNSNETKNLEFRVSQLKKLKRVLKDNESQLYDAIYRDFKKSKYETHITEIAILYQEIDKCLHRIYSWAKPKKVSTDLANIPARSYIIPEPLGVCLVIGAWNYPYQLSLLPAISAIAAGNTVVLKPSEIPDNTSREMARVINENFKDDFFKVIEGGVEETTKILELAFDKIFFTGSTNVGRIVYQAAAKNLTPVTLELGGKSPTFVMKDANINMTAKRIVWAKFLNAGQTCIAPDYILVEKEVQEKLIAAIKKEIDDKYDLKNGINDNYVQIVNNKNYDRLVRMIDRNKVCHGGELDQENRLISPCVLKDVNFDDEIMKEEIFGPILPIISFTNLNQVISKIKKGTKPLSLYAFTRNGKTKRKILSELSFGGGCINDAMMHFGNANLPFGGVGHSGMGNYHGKAGFNCFSHFKSVLDKPFLLEPNIKYAPYSKLKFRIINWLLK